MQFDKIKRELKQCSEMEQAEKDGLEVVERNR
jgi:hypothetical protein